jgi:hypothetical protein
VRLVADPRQVEPCVGPDISTPPQRGGGEGVAGGNIEHLSVRELAVHVRELAVHEIIRDYNEKGNKCYS